MNTPNMPSPPEQPEKPGSVPMLWQFVFGLVALTILLTQQPGTPSASATVSYSDVKTLIRNGDVREVTLEETAIVVLRPKGRRYSAGAGRHPSAARLRAFAFAGGDGRHRDRQSSPRPFNPDLVAAVDPDSKIMPLARKRT